MPSTLTLVAFNEANFDLVEKYARKYEFRALRKVVDFHKVISQVYILTAVCQITAKQALRLCFCCLYLCVQNAHFRTTFKAVNLTKIHSIVV